jgi:predicted HicB family RNase H-like nuclease
MKKTSRLGMRVDPQNKLLWQQAAERAGLSLSAWIEKTLEEGLKTDGKDDS